MLKPANRSAKHCYEKALEASQKAANTQSAADQEFWLEREKHWFHLATSYEFEERVAAFVRNAPKTPICALCDVPMGIERLRSRGEGSTEYHYRCPICGAKQLMPAPLS
jgi:hypothetical protein